MITVLLMIGALSPAPQDTTLRLPTGGTITVESGLHPVLLDVGTGDQVSVRGGNARLHGNQITVSAGRQNPDGRIVVTVPSQSAVRLELGVATLVAADVPQQLHVESLSGDITTNGGTGSLRIETVSGRVEVRRFRGDRLDIESMSGSVDIDGATGTVRVEALSEPVRLRDMKSRSVHVEALNGSIEWTGSLMSDSRHRFESHNGDVTFRLPPSASARFAVTTYLGSFRSLMAVRTRGAAEAGGDNRNIVATVGNGAAQVEVETFNGDVVVRPTGES